LIAFFNVAKCYPTPKFLDETIKILH